MCKRAVSRDPYFRYQYSKSARVTLWDFMRLVQGHMSIK